MPSSEPSAGRGAEVRRAKDPSRHARSGHWLRAALTYSTWPDAGNRWNGCLFARRVEHPAEAGCSWDWRGYRYDSREI